MLEVGGKSPSGGPSSCFTTGKDCYFHFQNLGGKGTDMYGLLFVWRGDDHGARARKDRCRVLVGLVMGRRPGKGCVRVFGS